MNMTECDITLISETNQMGQCTDSLRLLTSADLHYIDLTDHLCHTQAAHAVPEFYNGICCSSRINTICVLDL